MLNKVVQEMIKHYHIYDNEDLNGSGPRDLVDDNMVFLKDLSGKGDKRKYLLECVVNYYGEDLQEYLLISTAGVSEEKLAEGVLVYAPFSNDMVPKDYTPKTGAPVGIHMDLYGGVNVVYQVDLRLGPEEFDDPLPRLAPMVADYVLTYRKGLNVADFEIQNAEVAAIPDRLSSNKNLKNSKWMRIELTATLRQESSD